MGKRGGVTSTSWKPGQSGNPLGKPKYQITKIKELLGPHAEEAVKQLVALLTAERLDPKIRLEVIREILDRIFGKPTAVIEASDDAKEMFGIVSAEMYASRVGATTGTTDQGVS